MPTQSLDNLTSVLFTALLSIFAVVILIALLGLSLYILLIWYKNRNREKESLESTLLQIAVPRDNEIKIDAAEQLFSSFASIGGGSLLKLGNHISFEIVGTPSDINILRTHLL